MFIQENVYKIYILKEFFIKKMFIQEKYKRNIL